MRKLIYLTYVVFFAAAFSLKAQKKESITLDPGAKLLEAKSVPNGLVMVTGQDYYLRSRLHYRVKAYYPDLSPRYDIKIKTARLTMQLKNSYSMVVSPTGNNVYFILPRTSLFGRPGNRQTVYHIDSVGAQTTFKLKRGAIHSRINVMFADDNYLYFVTKEKNPDRHNRKFPKLQFVRVAADNSMTKVWLDLPDPEADATEWSYLGHTREVSYFVSKTMDDFNKMVYRVAVIDPDGKLLDDFKLNVSTKDQFLPEYNYSSAEGTTVIHNHNYLRIVYHNNYGGFSSTTVKYIPYPESFGNLMFDPNSNGFYVYGITGNNPVKKKGLFVKQEKPQATGFYVYRFDEDGKEKWNYSGKLAGINDYFKSKAIFVERQVKLTSTINGEVRFQAFAKKDISTYELNSETGKLKQSFNNSFARNVHWVDLGTCRKSGDKSDMAKFMAKGEKGDYSQLNFRTLNRNIIVRNFYEDNKIDLYTFQDE